MTNTEITEMEEDKNVVTEESFRLTALFVTETGDECGSPFDIPLNIPLDKIRLIYNSFSEQDVEIPISFFVNDKEITKDLESSLNEEEKKKGLEGTIKIVCQPQAVFRVRAITRCTSSLPGHSEAVVSAAFSPDGQSLASGSGDTTVRFWDINTETPEHTCKSHRNWVLAIAWSPIGHRLASGCKNGEICIWDPETGKQVGKSLLGHKQWITAIVWEPLHLNGESRFIASASKDTTIRIWDTHLGSCSIILTGHIQSVTCLRWGGTGLIYSGSQDRTIKVWRSTDGVLCRSLEGHAHWINTMALSTDYVMRTGAFDPAEAEDYSKKSPKKMTPEERKSLAEKRYKSVRNEMEERLVSGSDDFTMYFWLPEKNSKSLMRMTGHVAIVNDVKFSPDCRLIASASFDKSIKIWDGKTGKFLTTLRGHVQSVYQVAWSADSRLLVSSSADSTIKLWSMKTRKLEIDLPGHADEVYAIDWAPDGQRVVSGGKDKVLKIWRK